MLDRFPRDPTTGKGPVVVRDCVTVNGVGIGWDEAARTAVASIVVDRLVDRTKVLIEYIPLIGRQRVELLGRMCYRPSSVLNHLLRNMEPKVLFVPLQRAVESQTALVAVFSITEEELPGAQFAFARGGVPHDDTCAVESLHLGRSNGGCGWPNSTVTAAYVFLAGLTDRLQLMRGMRRMVGVLPPVGEWL